MSQWDMFCASPSPSGHSKQICWPLIRVSELLSLCVSTKQARAHLMFLRSFSSQISKRPLSTSYVYDVCSSSYIKICSRVFMCTCAFQGGLCHINTYQFRGTLPHTYPASFYSKNGSKFDLCFAPPCLGSSKTKRVKNVFGQLYLYLKELHGKDMFVRCSKSRCPKSFLGRSMSVSSLPPSPNRTALCRLHAWKICGINTPQF
jgi:hypothetical protein